MFHMIFTLNTSYFFKRPELVGLSNVDRIGTEFLCVIWLNAHLPRLN